MVLSSMPIVCWRHTPPEAGTLGLDGGPPFLCLKTLSGEAQETHFMNVATAGPKLYVARLGKAEEKGYSESPFPEDGNQLGLSGHGVRVENSLTSFVLLHLQQEISFLLDTVLDTFPNQLTQSEEFLSLVDTGFFINTSIMPLLKPERKVDVILHLNYSAGSQIQVRGIEAVSISSSTAVYLEVFNT